MNRTIQIIISYFFKGFIPLIYLIFILAGVISALVSALIEYEVFAELYQKNINKEYFYLSIPFLIVFAFETTKVFLIFLNKQYSKSENSTYLTDKRHFLRLRYALILISAVATLIFSFYNLHNPEYDREKIALNEKIEIKYNTLIDETNRSFDSQYENETRQYISDNLIQQAEIDKQKGIYFRGSNEFRGEKYDEATKLKEKNLTTISNISNRVENERRAAISALSQQKYDEIKSSETELKTSPNSGNKMLSSTLQIINMVAEYPQWQYIAIIGFLSLILSIGLEYIIWSTFTILAINHGDIFDFSIQTEKYKNATEAEIEMYKADAEKETQTIANWARSITKTIKDKSRDIFIRNK
jgi:hypothetical protein